MDGLQHIAFIADGKHPAGGLPCGLQHIAFIADGKRPVGGLPNGLQHIAFIADGNRRWAKRHLLPRAVGHKRGFDKMIAVADHCADLGIPFVSFFAFSTENWNREKDEIDEIFRLIRNNLSKQTKHFVEKEIRVLFLGDLSRFDADFQRAAAECMQKTKDMKRMTLCLCVNYGGRADIVHAVNGILADRERFCAPQTASRDGAEEGAACASRAAGAAARVTEADISRGLYTADIPDPDLVVRTSGEMRVSNFMLWQMAYSELKFIDTLWPDITDEIIDGILAEFNKRDRRKGK